jgi:ankyrin repeat protein
MRKIGCGLLLLAALLTPAAAQSPDKAPPSPPSTFPRKGGLLFPSGDWPTLEATRIAQCDDSEWAQTIAEIKAADPEQDADKQIAAGDFSLKFYKTVVQRVVSNPALQILDITTTVVRRTGPDAMRCKLQVELVPAFSILHRAVDSVGSTWCGRAALLLQKDYADRYNRRVVGHQAYPHKDVCTIDPAGSGKISDRPTPEMIPAQIPDIATAARFGLTDRVAKFIADGVDVAQRDMFGFDALRWSVVRDYRAAFDLTIAAGGTPDFCSALEDAVKYDRVEPAALLARRCASPETRLKLLAPAVARGEIAVVRPLIKTEPVLHLTEADWKITLGKAVSAGPIEMVQLLLDHTSLDLWEKSRQGLLVAAALRQEPAMISLLLGRGADLADLGPALRAAVQRKAYEAVQALAKSGADLNSALPQNTAATDSQLDPLGRQSAQHERLSRLTDPPIFDATHPLMDFKMVDLLLELGASPNVRDASGRTPLMIAITHSQIYGKKAGASWIERFVPQRLIDGQEDWEHRGVEPVRALLAKGADVALADSAGLTALHHAARSDYAADIARLLIAHGADVNARDKAGKTPLDHAVDAGLVRMPDLLAKAGAKRGVQ